MQTRLNTLLGVSFNRYLLCAWPVDETRFMGMSHNAVNYGDVQSV
jgi:hypothetical protein